MNTRYSHTWCQNEMSSYSSLLSEMRNTPRTLLHSSRRPACKSPGFFHQGINPMVVHWADFQTWACTLGFYLHTRNLQEEASHCLLMGDLPSLPAVWWAQGSICGTSTSRALLGPCASCWIPLHPAASHCILLHPAASCCPVTKGELIHSCQLCWSRGRILPS